MIDFEKITVGDLFTSLKCLSIDDLKEYNVVMYNCKRRLTKEPHNSLIVTPPHYRLYYNSYRQRIYCYYAIFECIKVLYYILLKE